jgi:two-component system chemotaxis response regulator CheB
VAMVASAGGIQALSTVLADLPEDFPAAIAIVLHLSPRHPSYLAEILNRCTKLEVKQAQEGDLLCAGKVFVAPPNYHLLANPDGTLHLSDAPKIKFSRPSGEPLFTSVANSFGKNAIGVVLTGGDSDGSIGVQVIKERGGKTIAQDLKTSAHYDMPFNAIRTGTIDFILPLAEIAPKLQSLVQSNKPSLQSRLN